MRYARAVISTRPHHKSGDIIIILCIFASKASASNVFAEASFVQALDEELPTLSDRALQQLLPLLQTFAAFQYFRWNVWYSPLPLFPCPVFVRLGIALSGPSEIVLQTCFDEGNGNEAMLFFSAGLYFWNKLARKNTFGGTRMTLCELLRACGPGLWLAAASLGRAPANSDNYWTNYQRHRLWESKYSGRFASTAARAAGIWKRKFPLGVTQGNLSEGRCSLVRKTAELVVKQSVGRQQRACDMWKLHLGHFVGDEAKSGHGNVRCCSAMLLDLCPKLLSAEAPRFQVGFGELCWIHWESNGRVEATFWARIGALALLRYLYSSASWGQVGGSWGQVGRLIGRSCWS